MNNTSNEANCDWCGAKLKKTRPWQRFCLNPKKCHDLWWAEENKRKSTIPKLVRKHDEEIKEIKEQLGMGIKQ
jgi:hypothetical protein